MKLISGPDVSNLCDYSFGDQAGVVGQVYQCFMEDANKENHKFKQFVDGSKKDVLTLFIDNVRLYRRTQLRLECDNPEDQRWINNLQRNNDLLELCASIPYRKFIIFCNNEDTPIFSDLIIPDNVLGIFAANALGYKKKLYPFPYGVGRKLHHDDVRHDILLRAMQLDPKPKKLLYINHAEHTNLSARGNIREIFSTRSFATVGERCMYDQYVREIQNHKFMICPEGNAFDCHRNWEVLYLKRVPIMTRNAYLQRLYKDFPILWVDDYSNINKTLLLENEDLFAKSKNLDINLLHLYSVFNRAVKHAKDS